MQENHLQPEIKERFLELPKSIQEIILESGWEKTTRNIVDKYNLRIDQGAVIENEVMLTMFGFEKPENFKASLINEAKIDPETADKVVSEVNNEIFKLIKDQMILSTVEEDDDFEPTETGLENVRNNEQLESREQILAEIEKPEEKLPEKKPNAIIEANLNEPVVSNSQTIDQYRESI